jgi:carbonic anhydrase
MSAINTVLKANEMYAERYDPALGRSPAPELAIVTCMHPRLTGILEVLGLKSGDADVIRNAGTTVTEDVIRSLLVSTRVLGAGEILIVNHTGCGMMTFKDDELQAKLRQSSGTAVVEPARFFSFVDVEEDAREQVQKVRTHPWSQGDAGQRRCVRCPYRKDERGHILI